MTNIEERLHEIIDEMSENEKITLWDEYCNADNRMDDYIYPMDEFDELFCDMKAWDVARMCYYGEFCPVQDYFWFNGYGNAVSGDFPSDDGNSPYYESEVITYIIDNEDALYNDNIQAALDEREGEDDE